MKRLLFLICTLLCANVLMAQTRFIVGELQYEVTEANKVEVHDCMPSATSIVIPDTVTYQETNYCVTSIGAEAFIDCDNLTSVTMPNSVTSIGVFAFYYCSSLTSITIPNSVTSIGEWAFKGCSSLTSITIPNSVTYIRDYAFASCSSLTSITIPNSVTYIGAEAFRNCSSLTSVNIGNGVTYIGDFAFEYCDNLTSITIPNSVTSIREATFQNCSSLTSVTIPNSVTSIGRYAFFGCSSLTSVDIPNSVTSIEWGAFQNCSSLTSVTCLRLSAPSLGHHTFEGTPNYKILTIPCGANYSIWQNATTWESVDCFIIIGCLFTIGDLTYEVTSETEVKVQACTESATSVVIPETVTYQGTTYSVTSIASGAFNDCFFLQNVTCLATTPPTLEDNTVFPYPNIATLTVPCGTLEAYSAPTSFWNMFFAGRIEEDCEDNTGLEDAEETLLSFYPNPTKSEITFSQAIEKVEVIDLTGKAILTFSNAREINIESLPAGAYYLRLTNNDKAIMQKVIKQ